MGTDVQRISFRGVTYTLLLCTNVCFTLLTLLHKAWQLQSEYQQCLTEYITLAFLQVGLCIGLSSVAVT